MSKLAAHSSTGHMTNAQCVIAEARILFDVSGACFLPASRTLVFSDLHFEKGSSYGRKGLFLPPYDTRATLKRMAAVMKRYQPESVISLGDAFHDDAGEARMDEQDMCLLESLVAQCRFIWVLGNHDPLPPEHIDGEAVELYRTEGLTFRHQPAEGCLPDDAYKGGDVIGHYHPVAKVVSGGRSLRRKCFISDGKRLIVPSFGAFTGGLNILDTAFEGLLGETIRVHLLGTSGVYEVSPRHLRPDGGVNRA